MQSLNEDKKLGGGGMEWRAATQGVKYIFNY